MSSVLGGLFLSSGIAALAYWRQSLSKSGAVGAIITGTLTFTAGLPFALILIIFFVTSSALSKINSPYKEQARQQFSKGEQRDIWQVFANGGIPTLIAVLYLLTDNADWWLLYLAAFAAATADTWATEIGTLSRQAPRSILNLKPVEAGASGGITIAGTLGGMLGAALIGLAGILLSDLSTNMSDAEIMLLVTIAGTAGNLFDSFLGATVQAMYWCDDRQKLTEKPICQDGSFAKLIRGWSWVTNDVVNVVAAGFGVVVTVITSIILH